MIRPRTFWIAATGICSMLATSWTLAMATGGLFDGSAYLPIGFSGSQNSFGSAVLVDMDGDGQSDLVIADKANDRVEVRRGLGGQRFADPEYQDAGPFPFSLAVGDVTADGHPDVVVTNYFDSAISVLFGNGNGTLAPRLALPTVVSPRQVALADFDQDGRLDMIVCCDAGADFLCLFRSLGGGAFATRTDLSTGNTPRGCAAGDVDGDGKLDLLASCANGVAIHRGLGGGGFAPFALHDAAGAIGPIAVADVDEDTDQDIVVASGRDALSAVAVLRNLGGGALAPGLRLGEGYYSDGLAVVDLEHDGHPELLIINPDRHTLEVLHSTDGYQSASQKGFQAGFGPLHLSVGDLDGDGVDDACVGIAGSFIAILIGNDDGTLGNLRGVPSGPIPLQAESGDLNHDGFADLALSHGDGGLRVQLGDGAGGLGAPIPSGPAGYRPQLADLDGDGNLDAVALNESFVTALRGHGDGSFTKVGNFPIVPQPSGLQLGDVNGDGLLDAVAVGQGTYKSIPGRVSVLLGTGDGTFGAELPQLPNDDGWYGLALADFDGDGKLDLALTAFEDSVRVYLGIGDGTFAARSITSLPGSPLAMCTTRWNDDAWPDVVVCTNNSRLCVLLGDGTGGLTPGATHVVYSAGFDLRTSQLDAMGGPDAILVGTEGLVQVLRGSGDGGIADLALYGACSVPGGFAVADLNDDGRPDLAVTGQVCDQIAILLNSGDAPTATLLSPGEIEVEPGGVRLRWLGSAAPGEPVAVERREDGAGAWTMLGQPVSPEPGVLTYEDRAVDVGRRYGYRLAYGNGAGTVYSAESWVQIPGTIRLALEGMRPNPTSRGGAAIVSLSLASNAPATLRVFTIQGRLQRTTSVQNPSAGPRTIVLPHGWEVPPGVYFVQLRQGSVSDVQRIVITP